MTFRANLRRETSSSPKYSPRGGCCKAARVAALAELLKPLLVQFVAKVKDNVIATLAASAGAAILVWLGHIFG
jgi:hypothetical protein